MAVQFQNSKRYPVRAAHPETQDVYARTQRVVGSRGSVFVGRGYVDTSGQVLVWMGGQTAAEGAPPVMREHVVMLRDEAVSATPRVKFWIPGHGPLY